MERLPNLRLLLSRRNPRLRTHSQAGFGLVELLIALTLVAVGIAAALSVFASSIVDLQHTAKEGTALTLADRQLEAYRSMPFECIPQALPAGSTAWNSAGVTLPSGGDANCATPFTDPFPNPYAQSQSVTAPVTPDHRSYTVVTAVTTNSTDCPNTGTAQTVQITVSVNQTGNATVLGRQSSCFSSAGTTFS